MSNKIIDMFKIRLVVWLYTAGRVVGLSVKQKL